VSKVTVETLMQVLQNPKFRPEPTKQGELLADYLPYREIVQIVNPVPATPPCRDPFDVPFLISVLSRRTDYRIAGDKNSLELEALLPFAIVELQNLYWI
jgi:predicted nucleic acid-binding protein